MFGATMTGAICGGVLGLFIDNSNNHARSSTSNSAQTTDIFESRVRAATTEGQEVERRYQAASENIGATCLQTLLPYLGQDVTLREVSQDVAMVTGNPCGKDAAEVRINIEPMFNAAQDLSDIVDIENYIQRNQESSAQLRADQNADRPSMAPLAWL